MATPCASHTGCRGVADPATALAAIIIEPLDAPLTGCFAILENFGWHGHRGLLLIRYTVTSGPERSPIGRGKAMRGVGPLGGRDA
jgi:hypothetical protein